MRICACTKGAVRLVAVAPSALVAAQAAEEKLWLCSYGMLVKTPVLLWHAVTGCFLRLSPLYAVQSCITVCGCVVGTHVIVVSCAVPGGFGTVFMPTGVWSFACVYYYVVGRYMSCQ